jgi:two-component system phosphate regulon response regulator PhoB
MAEEFVAKPRDPAGFTVMVVDDVSDIRDIAQILLKREGFRSVAAVDGEDAFRKLEPRAPDLIILDLMMPGQSGYEFLRHLQGTQHSRIPIIVATARSFDSSTVGILLQEMNVIELYTKPLNWPAIMAAIHDRLRTRRPAQP